MPSFIKSPDDQTGISGGVASFVCQAVGDPKPRITWMKKGKKVSSQRFEVEKKESKSLCDAVDVQTFPFLPSPLISSLLGAKSGLCWRERKKITSRRFYAQQVIL